MVRMQAAAGFSPIFRTIEATRAGPDVMLAEGLSAVQDRADPNARQYAMIIAQEDPPPSASPEDALAEIREVLESIGDVCPECLAEG